MAIQKETHVCLIHVTTTDSVQFQDQVSIVLVPLVGRAKDAKVGNEQTSKQTTSKKLGEQSLNFCFIYALGYLVSLQVWMTPSISKQPKSFCVGDLSSTGKYDQATGWWPADISKSTAQRDLGDIIVSFNVFDCSTDDNFVSVFRITWFI